MRLVTYPWKVLPAFLKRIGQSPIHTILCSTCFGLIKFFDTLSRSHFNSKSYEYRTQKNARDNRSQGDQYNRNQQKSSQGRAVANTYEAEQSSYEVKGSKRSCANQNSTTQNIAKSPAVKKAMIINLVRRSMSAPPILVVPMLPGRLDRC